MNEEYGTLVRAMVKFWQRGGLMEYASENFKIGGYLYAQRGRLPQGCVAIAPAYSESLFDGYNLKLFRYSISVRNCRCPSPKAAEALKLEANLRRVRRYRLGGRGTTRRNAFHQL